MVKAAFSSEENLPLLTVMLKYVRKREKVTCKGINTSIIGHAIGSAGGGGK